MERTTGDAILHPLASNKFLQYPFKVKDRERPKPGDLGELSRAVRASLAFLIGVWLDNFQSATQLCIHVAAGRIEP